MKRTPTERKALERAKQIDIELGKPELDRIQAMPKNSPQRILASRRYALKLAAEQYIDRERQLESWQLYKTLKRPEEAKHYRVTWPDTPTNQIRYKLTDAYADVQQIEDSPLIPAYTKTHITWAIREHRFNQQIALCRVIDEIQKQGGKPYRTAARETQPFKLRPITRFDQPHAPTPQQELLFK